MKKSLLDSALKIARSKYQKHPENYRHFSFIIQFNKIVEWGVNHSGVPVKHYGYNKKCDDDPTFVPKTHSECDAFKKAKGLLDRSKPFEIINIRLNKKGKLRSSKPCDCCYTLLQELGCKSFYFTHDNGFAKICV